MLRILVPSASLRLPLNSDLESVKNSVLEIAYGRTNKSAHQNGRHRAIAERGMVLSPTEV